MKQPFLIIGLLTIAISCKGQILEQKKLTVENFDTEILNYTPIKNELNKKTYANGLFILQETKKRIIKNKNLDIVDYWNILTSFSDLNESNKNLEITFQKVTKSEGSCDYLESYEDYYDQYSKYLQPKLIEALKVCKNNVENKKIFNIAEYSKDNFLDKKLVYSINEINTLDQKDRNNKEIQIKLDIQNQLKIDSLYEKHKTYIGKTLVGNKFKSVMWQVIHHSNLEYMEKYFPLILLAVKQNELNESSLKYSIDRISVEKYNYQIFGSQGNIKMADDKIRKDVKTKYGIE